MNAKTISTSQLEKRLSEIKGSQMVQMVYTSTQKVLKRGNVNFVEYPILKRTNVNVQFNASYENAVNNRLEKKGLEKTFVASPLVWGEWKVANKIISHNGLTYVRFYLTAMSKPKVEFWYNGELLEGERFNEAKQFFQKSSDSGKQSDAGLDREEQAKPFTINIENIKHISLNGEKYDIVVAK